LNKKILILAITIVAFIAASGCIGGPVTVCGNGICETGETATSCQIDCGPKTGSLEVTVISSFIGGTHLSGAKVMVAGAGYDSNVAVTEYTNSDGIALFESLSPGAYYITASKEGYLPADANAEVVSEQITSVRIKLPFHPVIQYCGNGVCDANENSDNCPADCPSTTGNLQVTVIDINTLNPIQGAEVDLNKGGAWSLALKTKLLVKSIRMSLTRNIGIVVVERDGTTIEYKEGDEIVGLEGAGPYAGQEMTVKIAALVQRSATSPYEANFELYDSTGTLVDYQILGEGTYLNEFFITSQTAEVYYEGDEIQGLKGTGAYAGQRMTVKVGALVQTSSSAPYLAEFYLYDANGIQVHSIFVGAGTYLNQNFVDKTGKPALQTQIFVENVFYQVAINKGGVELIVMRKEVTNSQGIVLFQHLEPANYTVWAWKTGYYPANAKATVDAGKTTEMKIKLSKYS
jgi:hypothetical protein